MRIALFYHSVQSCWNNGHAHFLRGYATSLMALGHEVRVFEPENNWSLTNLLQESPPRMGGAESRGGSEGAGMNALQSFERLYPHLRSTMYDPKGVGGGGGDLDRMLEGVDLVIVHEWNDPALIRALVQHRAASRYALFFHDTHHRAVTAPHEMARIDLSPFDGVLVYGEVLREIYLKSQWCAEDRVRVWHEAADTRIFRPFDPAEGTLDGDHPPGDLVWIGNWGDDERSAELREFLIEPVRSLGITASIFGVRYPEAARAALRNAGIAYRGWLPNALAPEVFARHRITVHVPRRPYVRALPGIPTIRIFEALACGIPLVCSPWDDAEHLFTPGKDFQIVNSGGEMTEALGHLLDHPKEARAMAEHGLETIRRRHTTDHRALELLDICRQLGVPGAPQPSAPPTPSTPPLKPSHQPATSGPPEVTA